MSSLFKYLMPDSQQAIEKIQKLAYIEAISAGQQAMDAIRNEIAKRPLFVLFEDELKCDPQTDHQVPKNILPLFQRAFEQQQRILQSVPFVRLKSELDNSIPSLVKREVERAHILEEENFKLNGQLSATQRLLNDMYKALEQQVEQMAELKKSLELNAQLLKEQLVQSRRSQTYKPDYADEIKQEAEVDGIAFPEHMTYAQIKAFQKQFRQNQNYMSDMRREISSLTSSSQMMMQELGRINSLEQEISKLKGQILSQQQAIDFKEGVIEDQAKQYEAYQNEMESKNNELIQQMKDLRHQLDDLKNQLSDFKENGNKSDNEVLESSLKSKYNNLQKQLDAFEQEKLQLIKEHETTQREMFDRYQEKARECEELKVTQINLNNQADIQQQNMNVQNEIDQLKQTIRGLQSDKIQELYSKAQSDLQQKDKEITNLTRLNKMLNSESNTQRRKSSFISQSLLEKEVVDKEVQTVQFGSISNIGLESQQQQYKKQKEPIQTQSILNQKIEQKDLQSNRKDAGGSQKSDKFDYDINDMQINDLQTKVSKQDKDLSQTVSQQNIQDKKLKSKNGLQPILSHTTDRVADKFLSDQTIVKVNSLTQSQIEDPSDQKQQQIDKQQIQQAKQSSILDVMYSKCDSAVSYVDHNKKQQDQLNEQSSNSQNVQQSLQKQLLEKDAKIKELQDQVNLLLEKQDSQLDQSKQGANSSFTQQVTNQSKYLSPSKLFQYQENKKKPDNISNQYQNVDSESAKEEIKRLKQQIQQQEGVIDTLSKENSQKDMRIKELEAEISLLKDLINKYKTTSIPYDQILEDPRIKDYLANQILIGTEKAIQMAMLNDQIQQINDAQTTVKTFQDNLTSPQYVKIPLQEKVDMIQKNLIQIEGTPLLDLDEKSIGGKALQQQIVRQVTVQNEQLGGSLGPDDFPPHLTQQSREQLMGHQINSSQNQIVLTQKQDSQKPHHSARETARETGKARNLDHEAGLEGAKQRLLSQQKQELSTAFMKKAMKGTEVEKNYGGKHKLDNSEIVQLTDTHQRLFNVQTQLKSKAQMLQEYYKDMEQKSLNRYLASMRRLDPNVVDTKQAELQQSTQKLAQGNIKQSLPKQSTDQPLAIVDMNPENIEEIFYAYRNQKQNDQLIFIQNSQNLPSLKISKATTHGPQVIQSIDIYSSKRPTTTVKERLVNSYLEEMTIQQAARGRDLMRIRFTGENSQNQSQTLNNELSGSELH